MATGLQLIGALFGGSLVLSLLGAVGLGRPSPRPDDLPRAPILTPSQEASRLVRLREEQFAFEREQQAVALSVARRASEEDRKRFDEEVRRGRAIRQDALVREELRQTQQINARRRELELQVEANREAREFEAVARGRAAELAALVRVQDARRRGFEAFARSLAPGFTAAVGPSGRLSAIPPGSIVTPADVARGIEPLPFQIPTTTGQRITQIPGVFVGTGFRFKSVEQAQEFLLSSRLKAQAAIRSLTSGVRVG